MNLTIDEALMRGVAAHNKGELREAEEFYRSILESFPDHPYANHNLGLVEASLERPHAALLLFRTAIRSNPEEEQFWLSYIATLIEQQQFENAKQAIKQAENQGMAGEKFSDLEAQLVLPKASATGINRNPPQGQLSHLMELYKARRFEEAEKLARSIAEGYPEHQFAWKVLGALLSQTGRTDEALHVNQKAVALCSHDAEALNNLGISWQKLGKFSDAESCFKKAIGLKPDYPEARASFGNLMMVLGRMNEAVASYRNAVKLKPDYPNVYNNLGISLQAIGKLEEA